MELALDFILIGGIVVNLLILGLLFKIKDKQLPHRILFVFFTLLFTVSLFGYAQTHQVDWLIVICWVPEEIAPWCIAPLLLIYVRSIFLNAHGLLKRHWFHFIPALLYLLFIAIPFLISWLQQDFLFEYLRWLTEYATEGVIIIRCLYHIGYASFALLLFFRYKRLMKSNFSSLSEKEFLWIQYLLIGTLFVVGVDLVTEVLHVSFDIKFFGSEPSGGTLVLVVIIFLILYLGYYGVNQSRILLPQFLLVEMAGKSPEIKIPSYTFTTSEIQELEEGLQNLFLHQKPYLDEDLTLHKLATLLGTGDKKLSTFLNQHLQTTFFDLVNKARVASVKEKMASDEYDRYTLLGIAYESGFKSKTSFNRIFKKETGLSPSAFRKRQK